MKENIKKLFFTGVAAALLTGGNAMATLVFQTPTGSLGSDGSLSAQAAFTFGDGYLTIVLENLQPDIVSAGQTLSGISFHSSGITSSSVLGTSFNGEAITVASGGSYTDNPANNSLPSWTVTPGNGNINLTTIGGGKPHELITGPTSNDGKFDSINKGFVNSGFNPYVLETATFTISNGVFTANSSVCDVQFEFGTGPDTYIDGVSTNKVSSVPEPSTIVAGALLLLPFGISTARILRKSRVK